MHAAHPLVKLRSVRASLHFAFEPPTLRSNPSPATLFCVGDCFVSHQKKIAKH